MPRRGRMRPIFRGSANLVMDWIFGGADIPDGPAKTRKSAKNASIPAQKRGSRLPFWLFCRGVIPVCPNPRVRAFLPAERIRIGSRRTGMSSTHQFKTGRNACPTALTKLRPEIWARPRATGASPVFDKTWAGRPCHCASSPRLFLQLRLDRPMRRRSSQSAVNHRDEKQRIQRRHAQAADHGTAERCILLATLA